MRVLSPRECDVLASLTDATRGHVLNVLAAVPALHLTSGRRTRERNRAVGGVPKSGHLDGTACDFGGPSRALVAGLKYATRYGQAGTRTGPREALIHDAGSGVHLHLRW